MSGPLPKPDDRRQRRNVAPVVDLELVRSGDVPEARPQWGPEAVDAWYKAWASAQAAGWSEEQHHLAFLWGDALDRYQKLQAIADDDPLITDRFGVAKENPAAKMAGQAWRQMLDLADRLGIPFRSKVALGLAAAKVEDRSLKSLADRVTPKDPRQ